MRFLLQILGKLFGLSGRTPESYAINLVYHGSLLVPNRMTMQYLHCILYVMNVVHLHRCGEEIPGLLFGAYPEGIQERRLRFLLRRYGKYYPVNPDYFVKRYGADKLDITQEESDLLREVFNTLAPNLRKPDFLEPRSWTVWRRRYGCVDYRIDREDMLSDTVVHKFET